MSERHPKPTKDPMKSTETDALLGRLVIETVKMLPILGGFFALVLAIAWVGLKYGWIGTLIFLACLRSSSSS